MGLWDQHNKKKRQTPLFIARRPREGYTDYADRLDGETVRVGQTTFARKREPGQRHGTLLPREED